MTPYRDEAAALRARRTMLETELAQLRARGPEAERARVRVVRAERELLDTLDPARRRPRASTVVALGILAFGVISVALTVQSHRGLTVQIANDSM